MKKTKKTAGIGLAVTLVGTVALFLFFQIGFPYHLRAIEQRSLYLPDIHTTGETLRLWIVQFFYYIGGGPALLTALLVLLGWIAYRLLRGICLPRLVAYTAVVVLTLSIACRITQIDGHWFSWPSSEVEQLLAIDTEASFGHWNEVKRLTDIPSSWKLGNTYRHLALAHEGHLADSLFAQSIPTVDELIPTVDNAGNYFVFRAAGEVWWNVGHLTLAEHATMLGMIFSPNHTGSRVIRRLAEINLKAGDATAAAKYLRMLSQSLPHRAWATRQLQKLTGLPPIDWHDTLCLSTQYGRALRSVMDNGYATKVTLDYLLCLDLLLCNLQDFRRDFEQYAEKNPRILPRIYQEAMLVAMSQDTALRDTWHDYIQAETYEAFVRFNRCMEEGQKPEPAFRRTYWQYLLNETQKQQ